jgi:dolichyl-phosphate-mannose--protein O-mannosyl transferase
MPLHPALGYAMVALAATLFAINGTVSKVILGSESTRRQLTEVRCAGALVGLVLIALATRPASCWRRSSRSRSSSRPSGGSAGAGSHSTPCICPA